MKNLLFFPMLITGLCWVGLSGWLPSHLPAPTDPAQWHEESESLHRQREIWMENMHRAAPGTDWRAIDARTRWAKARSRFEKIKSLPASRSNAPSSDTLANGQLWGHWRELGSNNQSGRIHLAAFDSVSSTVFLASAGGHIWKGNLQGSQWEVRNDLYRIRSLNFLGLVKRANSLRLLAGSGDSRSGPLLYSDDEGLTWQLAQGLEGIPRYGWGGVLRGYVSGDSLQSIYLLAQEWDGVNWTGMTVVYRSVDRGETFSALGSFSGNSGKIDLWAQGDAVFLLKEDELYRLSPSSIFTKVADLPATPPGNVLLTGAVHTSGIWLYALYRDGGNSHIYRSSNGGQNWGFQGTVNSGTFRRTSFACDPTEPQKVFVGGVDCYRSFDSGQNWNKVNSWVEYYSSPATRLHADIPSMQPFWDDLGRQLWLIHTDGGTYLSRDDLMTVMNISLRGLNVSQYYSTYTDEQYPDIIHLGSQDQGYQRGNMDEHNGPRNFEQIISGDYGHLVSGDSGVTLWMNYPGFSAFYPNARSSRSKSDWRFVQGMGALWLPPLIADPQLPARAYLAGGTLDPANQSGESHIIRLDYAFGSVTATELPFDFSSGGNSTLSALAISPLNPNFWFACTDNGAFYFSNNAGSTWIRAQGFSAPGSHYFYGNRILPSLQQTNRLYLAGSGYSNAPVYYSLDYGQTFRPMDAGLPATLVYDLAATPDESLLFAATEVGPYVYVAADSQWHEMEGLHAPDQTYWTVEYIPERHTARFGTYGRGVWDFVTCSGNVAPAQADFVVSGNGNTFLFDNQSQNSFFYHWDFGDGNTSTAKIPLHTYAGPGVYQVTLIAGNYCSADTLVEQVAILGTGIGDELGKGAITLFPNPSDGHFQLKNEGENIRQARLQVVDLFGREVLRTEKYLWWAGESWKIDLQVTSGQYVLLLSDREGKLSRREKIIIQ